MTDTKTRILDTALNLFNRAGERNVTTNHIAEDLGISPGNLYYHYRNKAAIVAALFERYQEQIRDLLTVPEGPLTWQDKMRYFEGILESWEPGCAYAGTSGTPDASIPPWGSPPCHRSPPTAIGCRE